MIKKNIIILVCILINLLIKNIPIELQVKEEINRNKINVITEKNSIKNNILVISKIHLYQEYYSYDSLNNTVSKGIEQLSKDCSIHDSCNIVLASHSGSAIISYFKNLSLLKELDQATVIENDEKQNYTLIKINHQKKDGKIMLPSSLKHSLVLTTCNKTDQTLQDIYIFSPN